MKTVTRFPIRCSLSKPRGFFFFGLFYVFTFLIAFIGVTSVNEIILVSGVHNLSPVCCIVCLPPQVGLV